jgi:uncharacterized phage protein gp47/JayE
MPWDTPGLGEVRRQARDYVTAYLPGADASLPNSVLRVLSDTNAGLAHGVFLYLDWQALQYLPDTAESEWLDRHADIWLNGRKTATYATGTASVTGIAGTVLPIASRLTGGSGAAYETTAAVTVGPTPAPVAVRALTPGVVGNLDPGSRLGIVDAISGVDGAATVISLLGGVDEESDALLRARVLQRIQNPPMGGAAHDYERWSLEVPGVTRAWCAPNEMGIGTITVRVMFDELRATSSPSTSGFPLSSDLAAVTAHLDTKRPVAVKDFWVVSPIPEPIDFTVSDIDADSVVTHNALEASVAAMIRERAAPSRSKGGVLIPAQTIHREWVSAAMLDASGVESFELTMADHVMPSNGHLGVMGTVTYA